MALARIIQTTEGLPAEMDFDQFAQAVDAAAFNTKGGSTVPNAEVCADALLKVAQIQELKPGS